jgi:aspartate aminotransferase
VFESLKTLPADAILGIMTLFRADASPRKVDLSVGVYQDETGRTPVLECVKQAEREIVEEQDTKTYVAIAGNPGFNRGVEELLYGKGHAALADGRVATVQAPGGSGGLSVAAHLLARVRPGMKVYMSDPTWPNHSPLLKLAGLTLEQYPYYDYASHSVKFDAMAAAIENVAAGDSVLLHGCCHNPCGADLKREQWDVLAGICEKRGIVPFIDIAYQGLAESLEADAYGVRLMAERVPEVVVVTSCSKNLGLYRERVGSVSIVSKNKAARELVLANLANVARSIYSMPPDHGAAIAERVLHSPKLRKVWDKELTEMRSRLNGLRTLFVKELKKRNVPLDFSFIANERGLFSFLGIGKGQVVRLREQFHVYMVESSRINFAGINKSNVDYVADSIAAVLKG